MARSLRPLWRTGALERVRQGWAAIRIKAIAAWAWRIEQHTGLLGKRMRMQTATLRW